MQEAQLFQCARIKSDNITQYRNPYDRISHPMSHPFGGNRMNGAASGQHTGVNLHRIAMRAQVRRIAMRVTPLTDCNFLKVLFHSLVAIVLAYLWLSIMSCLRHGSQRATLVA